MIRIFLFLTGVSFALFGAWSLLSPFEMTSGLGLNATGPNAAYELRGIYGGVSLGAAMLTLSSLFKPSLRRPALWFIAAYTGGYMFARVAALALGPAPTAYFWSFVAFELTLLVCALLSLRALNNTEPQPSS